MGRSYTFKRLMEESAFRRRTAGIRIGCLLLGLTLHGPSHAQNQRLPADQWLDGPASFPAMIDTNSVRTAGFDSLHAEVVAGRLRIIWQPEHPDTNSALTLFVSEEEPGHWPARDWQSYTMGLRGSQWETNAPVEDLDVPLVYFVRATARGVTHTSPMRLCRPRDAGLEEPTRIFWPFLEGFEEGIENWHLLANQSGTASLRVDANARNGQAALLVVLPAGRRSVTVATTHVRGWQIQNNSATGLRLWLRTRGGTGRARFTLLGNAGTTNQVAAVSSLEPGLTNEWRRVDLPFNSFPRAPLRDVDLFTIEFIGAGPREFLIDDLQLLGRWKLVPE